MNVYIVHMVNGGAIRVEAEGVYTRSDSSEALVFYCVAGPHPDRMHKETVAQFHPDAWLWYERVAE